MEEDKIAAAGRDLVEQVKAKLEMGIHALPLGPQEELEILETLIEQLTTRVELLSGHIAALDALGENDRGKSG